MNLTTSNEITQYIDYGFHFTCFIGENNNFSGVIRSYDQVYFGPFYGQTLDLIYPSGICFKISKSENNQFIIYQGIHWGSNMYGIVREKNLETGKIQYFQYKGIKKDYIDFTKINQLSKIEMQINNMRYRSKMHEDTLFDIAKIDKNIFYRNRYLDKIDDDKIFFKNNYPENEERFTFSVSEHFNKMQKLQKLHNVIKDSPARAYDSNPKEENKVILQKYNQELRIFISNGMTNESLEKGFLVSVKKSNHNSIEYYLGHGLKNKDGKIMKHFSGMTKYFINEKSINTKIGIWSDDIEKVAHFVSGKNINMCYYNGKNISSDKFPSKYFEILEKEYEKIKKKMPLLLKLKVKIDKKFKNSATL
ncbi:hypothetical protein [Candidatus Deianiraea vastatrix]|uniref:Uncharacterized protein n=1 Tax=Candidatus Deianiraea vastatrix TaxID=2163644 RepID=A0A5B8XD97_9RICK|nr:hypothetical protein [Candidatus Deianiraea vastatrix]QED23298.1 hypothetical protein Deia_00501 [Candidatus Deianiraea vastatrix]